MGRFNRTHLQADGWFWAAAKGALHLLHVYHVSCEEALVEVLVSEELNTAHPLPRLLPRRCRQGACAVGTLMRCIQQFAYGCMLMQFPA